MSDKKEKKTDDSGNCMIFGMLIGMSIGFALGQPLFNNMAAGMASGTYILFREREYPPFPHPLHGAGEKSLTPQGVSFTASK